MSTGMTDEELIAYCDAHSETPRALFVGGHVNRMYVLAGSKNHVDPTKFFTMHETMKHLVKLARERISDPNEPTEPTQLQVDKRRIKKLEDTLRLMVNCPGVDTTDQVTSETFRTLIEAALK